MAGVLDQSGLASQCCLSPGNGHLARDEIVTYPPVNAMHIMVALQNLRDLISQCRFQPIGLVLPSDRDQGDCVGSRGTTNVSL